MATPAFPVGIRFITSGFGEAIDASVERTEMERGIPKQAIINDQVMATITGTLLFGDNDDINTFDDFYYNQVKRAGWFTMRHPRTKVIMMFRFPSGDIGTLTPVTNGFGIASREVKMEYMR